MAARFTAATVAALTSLLFAPGATGSTPHRVPLTVSITGNGTVRLSTGRQLTCSGRCRKTFLVRKGATIGMTARASTGWIFSSWAGSCTGAKAVCRLRLRRKTQIAVTFGAPGTTTANPIPLGHAAAVGRDWNVTVVSATIDATAQIVAIPYNSPPHPGAQYTMLDLSATYTGGGSSVLDDGGDIFQTIGVHHFAYQPCYEDLPPPELVTYTTVYSGQTISGNICYEIASNDADSLMMFASYYDATDQSEHTVWFALK